MKIISLKTESQDLGRIELSDGSLFSFRNCYLPLDQIKQYITNPSAEGCEITESDEIAFRFASVCLRAEKNALRLIARAEQCTGGLRRKLEKRGFDSSCINAVLERLIDLRLLDDRRFAQHWLQSRLRLPRSPRRLLVALYSRGIDREDAESAIKGVLDEEAEYSLLLRFVKKYMKKKDSQSDVKDIKFFLRNEGFSRVVIQQFLEEK